MMRVADYIVQRLYDQGVKHVFMITGRGILFLSDAVARHENIENIPMHHEQAAAFAAMAYAQHNNKIGACITSTGCASTNTITALLCAWQDDVPCIFISGQNKLSETSRYTGIPIRTFGQQEADIISVVEPLTKYATMITNHKKIAYEIDKAFFMANEGRKGPVWIDIPLDIQNMRVEPEELERFDTQIKTLKPTNEDVKYVVNALKESERPVILLGGGVRSANATYEIEKFINNNSIPVTFDLSAVDIYGENNKLSIGTVGSLGASRSGNFTVQNSDLLIVIGCRLSSMITGEEYQNFARSAKIIVIDIDQIEHSKNNIKIDKLIISDAKEFLLSLMDKNIKKTNNRWIDKCLHWKKIFPKCEDKYKTKIIDLYYFSDCLSKVLPDDMVLITDSGLEELIVPSTVSFKKGQRCIHTPSQGSMGYALPASIGVYYSHKKDVITVVGDGSIMMNLQELQTISYFKIPIKVFIINNNGYSVIRTRQEELFRQRTIGTDSTNGVGLPNFEKVAECFNLPYIKIKNSTNLDKEIKSIINLNGPVICEVIAVEDQEYIKNSYALNSNKRVVRRPIEDQAPFMDRKFFLSEMIIKPID